MALLVDKLRPRSLDALSYHPDLSARLKSLVSKTYPVSNLWQAINSDELFGFRLKAEISLTSLSMARPVRARKLV